MHFGHHLREHWLLDPTVTFLNHGSFGACPRPVLAAQDRIRVQMESQPPRFFLREYDGLLADARCRLSAFLGAEEAGLAFIPNATMGVNAVLSNIVTRPGDEWLITSHAYGACLNAMRHNGALLGVRVKVADIPFPSAGHDEILESVMRHVGPRTRLALLDHVTSPSGLVLPIERLVQQLQDRGIETLIDGAHAPGMIPLNLTTLGAGWYTGNCHKWLCTPKGSAFLYVREDLRNQTRPQTIGHGATIPETVAPRFRHEFDWPGTHDPTPFLSVPTALTWMGRLAPGGWKAVMDHNRALALRGRGVVMARLGLPEPAPASCVAAMASLRLPVTPLPLDVDRVFTTEPLQDALLSRYGVEVPVFRWPDANSLTIRLSAQVYNDLRDYQRLADALADILRPCETSGCRKDDRGL